MQNKKPYTKKNPLQQKAVKQNAEPKFNAPRHRLSKGLIHVYTGEGKGKTTAAVGLAIRAAGTDLKVGFFQFFKKPFSGVDSERASLILRKERDIINGYFGDSFDNISNGTSTVEVYDDYKSFYNDRK